MTCGCCLCAICGCGVLAVVACGGWAGLQYRNAVANPPSVAVQEPMWYADLDAATPSVEVRVPVQVNNTLGWPLDTDVEAVDVDVFSEDMSDAASSRYFVGQAMLMEDTEVPYHSAANMVVVLRLSLNDVTAFDTGLQERLGRDCLGDAASTKMRAEVRRVSLRMLFGLGVDVPSDVFAPESFVVDCKDILGLMAPGFSGRAGDFDTPGGIHDSNLSSAILV